jgi:hypothetical protein
MISEFESSKKRRAVGTALEEISEQLLSVFFLPRWGSSCRFVFGDLLGSDYFSVDFGKTGGHFRGDKTFERIGFFLGHTILD